MCLCMYVYNYVYNLIYYKMIKLIFYIKPTQHYFFFFSKLLKKKRKSILIYCLSKYYKVFYKIIQFIYYIRGHESTSLCLHSITFILRS